MAASTAIPTCDGPGPPVSKATRSPARIAFLATALPVRYWRKLVRGTVIPARSADHMTSPEQSKESGPTAPQRRGSRPWTAPPGARRRARLVPGPNAPSAAIRSTRCTAATARRARRGAGGRRAAWGPARGSRGARLRLRLGRGGRLRRHTPGLHAGRGGPGRACAARGGACLPGPRDAREGRGRTPPLAPLPGAGESHEEDVGSACRRAERRKASAAGGAASAQTRRAPQVAAWVSPGSRRTRPSPLRNAFGAQVIGSVTGPSTAPSRR